MDTDDSPMPASASTPTSKLVGDKPTRKPRGFKIALIILAVLLVLFVCTIVFLPYFLPIGTIRSIAKSQAKDIAGMDVDFKDLSFGWNGDVVLGGISLAPLGPDGTPGETLLTVDEVRTNVALTPLLSGKAVVNSVDVYGFVLKVKREADGSMNLPDFEKLGQQTAAIPTGRAENGRRRAMLSTASAAEGGGSLPPIELHNMNLHNGVIAFEDVGQALNLDLGVDQVKISGKTLDDPFVFSGRVLPYREQPQLGDITFSGRAAMLQAGQFNPDGEASLEATINNLSLTELAAKLHLDQLLASAQANGMVKAAYANRKGGLNVSDMRLSKTAIGMGEGALLTLPDSTVSLDAAFDPEPGSIEVASASLANDIVSVLASGRMDGVLNLAQGGMPTAAFDFSGSTDFTNASRYVSSQDLGLGALPQLEGKGGFAGTLTLPAQQPGAPLAPTLALDFNEGELQALESGTGIVAGSSLKGIGVRAAASIAVQPAVTARLNLAAVPVHALVPQLGHANLNATVNGGAALEYAPGKTVVELRVADTTAQLPATPYTAAAAVTNAAIHVTADLVNDVVTIHGANATINEAIRGGVAAGTINGILAGSPQGTIDLQLSSLLEQLKELAAPVYPADLIPQLAGTLRASTRIKLENNTAEAMIRSEIDNTQALLALEPLRAQAQVAAPKATLALMASASLDKPTLVTLHSLEAAGSQANLRFQDADGRNVAGQVGNGLVKLAAVVDADAMQADVSAFSIDVGGLNASLSKSGSQMASLATGLMKAIIAAPDRKVVIPLAGHGDFSLPSLDLGVDNLVFHDAAGGGQPTQLGGVRARLGVDGYIGTEKRQLINIRTASLAATPAAVNSRAQIDLGSGAFLAEYAARVAPAGLSSLLVFMGLPPSLLSDAAVTGTVEFDGSKLNSKGAAQGQMQIAQGQVTPFEMAHDIAAAWNPTDRSLNIAIRRLDGSMKTASGEAVATMAAQQSQLLLSRAGSRGMLDIRFNGSAGPTRAMLLGFAGVFPQLGSLANTLHSMQADGIYSAWVQVGEKDPVTLAINIGGTWKGAALTLNNTPFLSEAGELAAALEGELAYQQNALNISRLFLRSESAQMRGDGTAKITFTADDQHMPNGLANIETDMKFVMADLSRAAKVFPGVIPAEMALTGRIDGALRAGGDAGNVQIHQGEVRFQNFRAVPTGDLEVTIPSGAAVLGATMAFHFAGASTGSPFDIFRMIDVRDGKASLTGAQVRGKQVSNMSSTFQLEKGVLTLHNAQVALGDGAEGSVLMNGVVDFNGAQPSVNTRLALRNIPLAEFNSEVKDFMSIEQGIMNLPAQEGQAASVAFVGMSEDDILRTLKLDNFNFATGPIKLHTGPVLNQELDKARGLMRQKIDSGNKSREITLKSITGTAQAGGNGVITFPESDPINVLGDNTGDFRIYGSVRADHTLSLRAMVAGGLERLIGFTLPNLIPSLRQNPEESNRFMAKMNENAAKGNYGINIKGNLDSPDISGISDLAVRFISDMATALPGQLIGGVLDLGKDAPQALKNLGEGVVGGILNPGDTLKNAPENIVRAPENVVKGLGQMFGITRNKDRSDDQQQEESQDQEVEQQQEQQRSRPRLPFGIR